MNRLSLSTLLMSENLLLNFSTKIILIHFPINATSSVKEIILHLYRKSKMYVKNVNIHCAESSLHTISIEA